MWVLVLDLSFGLHDVDSSSLGIDDGALATFLSSLLVKLALFRFWEIIIRSIFLCKFDRLFCCCVGDVGSSGLVRT